MRECDEMRLFWVAFLFAVSFTTFAQSGSVLGHQQDFPGYYNPALSKNSKFSEVGLVYRSQWTELSYPNISTLYFRHPLKTDLPVLDFRSVGLILQNEDFQFLQRSSVAIFTSNTLVENKNFSIGVGLGAQLLYQGLNYSALSEKEMLDPEIGMIDNGLQLVMRYGLSLESGGLRVGAGAETASGDPIRAVTAYAERRIRLKSSKFLLIPSALYRYSETGQSQVEGQLRTVYDKKVALTVGYRQDYGAVAQLGFLIGSLKASYGAELPATGRNELGMTHEILASYQFQITHEKRHKRDSLIKHQRDSLNRARLEQLRAARLQQAKERVRQDSLDNIAKDSISKVQENEKLVAPPRKQVTAEEVITFDEIPTHLKDDNTHVILRHIGFEEGYDILKPYAYQELDKLNAYLHHHHNLFLEIQGHTDNIGSSEDNYELSRRRALTVYNYLVSRGIATDRMSIVGYGEDQPLYDNNTEEGRRLNRRIEVVFIKSK